MDILGIGGFIKKARIVLGLNKAYKRGEKKGLELMADKPMMKSKTFWGVLITQIVPIIETVGGFLQGTATVEELFAKAATTIGIIVAAFGARKAIGSAIESANGKPKV